jgi:hypothetical protein
MRIATLRLKIDPYADVGFLEVEGMVVARLAPTIVVPFSGHLS